MISSSFGGGKECRWRNPVGAANKGENQVGASEQGFRGVCAIRL